MGTLPTGAVLILLAGAAVAQATQPSTGKSYSSATADFAGAGQPGEWTSQARDYANTRYSPLDQINADNVGRLKVAWTFSDGTQYGHEGAPLVVGDTMYVVTPYPNTAYALDLTKPGPSIKWKFDPNPSPAGDRQGLLRRGAPRLGLRRRQADLQPARRPHRRRRRRDRQGGLADRDGRASSTA